MRTWLGYHIPVTTLPPSLVLVKRLFLSGKSISDNILYLLITYNFTIVINNNFLFVLIVTTSLLWVWVRRYSAHVLAYTRTRLSCLGLQERRTTKVTFLFMFQMCLHFNQTQRTLPSS